MWLLACLGHELPKCIQLENKFIGYDINEGINALN